MVTTPGASRPLGPVGPAGPTAPRGPGGPVRPAVAAGQHRRREAAVGAEGDQGVGAGDERDPVAVEPAGVVGVAGMGDRLGAGRRLGGRRLGARRVGERRGREDQRRDRDGCTRRRDGEGTLGSSAYLLLEGRRTRSVGSGTRARGFSGTGIGSESRASLARRTRTGVNSTSNTSGTREVARERSAGAQCGLGCRAPRRRRSRGGSRRRRRRRQTVPATGVWETTIGVGVRPPARRRAIRTARALGRYTRPSLQLARTSRCLRAALGMALEGRDHAFLDDRGRRRGDRGRRGGRSGRGRGGRGHGDREGLILVLSDAVGRPVDVRADVVGPGGRRREGDAVGEGPVDRPLVDEGGSARGLEPGRARAARTAGLREDRHGAGDAD